MPVNLSIIVSAAAVVISLISLWVSNLAPPKITSSNKPPRFRAYEILPEQRGEESGPTWWIPSFEVEMTVVNSGQRPGTVEDVRISATIDGEKFHFYPKWVVNTVDFNRHANERFIWISEAVERGWYSTIVQSGQSKQMHLILEGPRFDEKKTGKMEFSLEMKVENSGWVSEEEYHVSLWEDLYGESSISPGFDRERADDENDSMDVADMEFLSPQSNELSSEEIEKVEELLGTEIDEDSYQLEEVPEGVKLDSEDIEELEEILN